LLARPTTLSVRPISTPRPGTAVTS
jgi:hypothetical protein